MWWFPLRKLKTSLQGAKSLASTWRSISFQEKDTDFERLPPWLRRTGQNSTTTSDSSRCQRLLARLVGWSQGRSFIAASKARFFVCPLRILPCTIFSEMPSCMDYLDCSAWWWRSPRIWRCIESGEQWLLRRIFLPWFRCWSRTAGTVRQTKHRVFVFVS